MRFTDLCRKKEEIKDELDATKNTNQTQQQQINQLLESVDTLSNTVQTQQQQIDQLTNH